MWTGLVRQANRWTVPVGEAEIGDSKAGNIRVVLTPTTLVPADWFPPKGASMLCLASGGGQQVPVLAAAGYRVTSFDLTPLQLEADKTTCERFGLDVSVVQGDMADLSAFADASFDCVFNPCSTTFVPDVVKVYREVARVLKPGGIFMTGWTKPVYYLFDILKLEKGEFVLKYKMPYSDLHSLDENEKNHFKEKGEPLVFGHSLTDLISGQLEAGLSLTHLFEDDWGGKDPVDAYFKPFVATRSVKRS